MGLSKYFLAAIALSLVILSSGCITKTGGDITSVAKAIPEVKSFLSEYPNATVVVALWDNTTVYDNIASIRAECGNQFSVKDYYRVSISDPSLSLVVWLDRNSLVMTCAVRKQTTQAKNEEKGNIVEQEPINVTPPQNHPNTTTSTIIDYCGNGKCDAGEDSTSCTKDCATTAVPLCGNAVCDSGETAENCPNDCAYEIYPYESDSQFCQDSGNVPYTSTGPNYAHWFLYGGCGSKKYFHVMPGYKIVIYAYTDSCSECVCYHPNFYIYELVNGTWINMKYVDLPDEKGISKYITYIPVSYTIKLYATGCFYVNVYSEVPVAENQTDCNQLYWFDSSLKECGYKKFCGLYMYSGLQTFADGSECNQTLQAMKNATNQTVIIPPPVTPSTVATTTTIQDYCNDTDGGTNYYAKGTITIGYAQGTNRTEQDSCNSDGTLREWFCGTPGDPAGLLRSENYVACPYGCLNGTCLPASTTTTTIQKFCNDTDGGINYAVKGTCIDNSGTYTDNCSSSTAAEDWYCAGGSTGNCALVGASCAYYGYGSLGCSDGKCINGTNATTTLSSTTSSTTTSTTIPNTNCTDSDGGFNYFMKGTVTWRDPGTNTYVNQTEFCIDSTTLAEYFCKQTAVISNGTGVYANGSTTTITYISGYIYIGGYINYTCTYGCSNGACNLNQATTTSSTTTSTSTTSTTIQNTSCESFCRSAFSGYLSSFCTNNYSYIQPYFCMDSNTRAANNVINNTFCSGYPADYKCVCQHMLETCPYTCSNGNCTSPTTTTTSSTTTTTIQKFCNDTDGGTNYVVKGTCIDNSGTYVDYCNSYVAFDYYCTSSTGNCALIGISCTYYGYTGCLNGACINSTG